MLKVLINIVLLNEHNVGFQYFHLYSPNKQLLLPTYIITKTF